MVKPGSIASYRCSKPDRQVNRLIAYNGAYICDSCVMLSYKILHTNINDFIALDKEND